MQSDNYKVIFQIYFPGKDPRSRFHILLVRVGGQMLMCLRQEKLACPGEKAEQQYGSELETPIDVPFLRI